MERQFAKFRLMFVLITAFLLLVSVSHVGAAELRVDCSYPDSEDFDNDSDFAHIQDAIYAAETGDVIILADGIYKGSRNRSISFLGKNITVKSQNGPANCIIDCEHQGTGFYLNMSENNSALISGITVQNGTGGGSGGGIYCDTSSPTIYNCVIKDCQVTTGGGGGICCVNGSSQIIKCVIIRNKTFSPAKGGGGIYCAFCSPCIRDCLISGNASNGYGGGIYFETVKNAFVSNCEITKNTSSSGGGIISLYSSANITNCTVADNFAGLSWGGLYQESSRIIITNSIFWNDQPAEINYHSGSTLSVTYSDIQGGWPGIGNINSNPLFVVPGPGDRQVLGDYHLLSGSPCIDAGTPVSLATDIDGNSRPFGSGYDMGAYEWCSAPNQSPVADAGTNQTVHIGNLVTLDGSNSNDPDANVPLTYNWSIKSKPATSSSTLSNSTLVNPTFIPDTIGDYVIELTVTDKLGAVSAPSVVTISTQNSCPIANAGPDQPIHGKAPQIIALNGSQSWDPDGDQITYLWEITSRPEGSTATLDNPASVQPFIMIDIIGEYRVCLTVSDGWCTSTSDEVSISYYDVRPVAIAKVAHPLVPSIILGESVTLDASGSYDSDGDIITYFWTITSKPAESLCALSDPSSFAPSCTPNIAGTYVIQLVVNDGLLSSNPSTVQVQVITRMDAAISDAQSVQAQIASLPPLSFKNATMQNALLNKMNAVIANIEAGQYQLALDQLQNDVKQKTNGCAEIGAVDKNDWITDCETQSLMYPLISKTIATLQPLL